MGIDFDFGSAFAKSQLAAGQKLPTEGSVFVSVRDSDKDRVLPSVRKLADMGFNILASHGTSEHLEKAGIPNEQEKKSPRDVPTPSITSRTTLSNWLSTRHPAGQARRVLVK